MNVMVVSEVRFSRVADGSVWADASPYAFWQRYLDEFDGVTIVGREDRIEAPLPGMTRVDGARVQLRGMPHYLGSREFVMNWRAIRDAVRPLVEEPAALILRLGSLLALGLERRLINSGRPYGVEVVGDPWDTFAPGVVDTPMRPVVRHILTRSQQRLCAGAAAAAYVTDAALQRRYPCPAGQWAVSDVEIDTVSSQPNAARLALGTADASRVTRLVTVGSLAQRYKGIDVLIEAVAAVNGRGHACELTVVGDGRYRGELEALASSLGVAVTFTGQLTRADVMTTVSAADMFVLASRTEGLPRALIEAMALGLPCVATRVGGIPELLDPAVLCEPGSKDELADRIVALVTGRIAPAAMSARNITRAGDFNAATLRLLRRDFYRWVRTETARWNEKQVAA